MELLERRTERQKQTGEIFTPITLVHKMLAKLPKEVWLKDKTLEIVERGKAAFDSDDPQFRRELSKMLKDVANWS